MLLKPYLTSKDPRLGAGFAFLGSKARAVSDSMRSSPTAFIRGVDIGYYSFCVITSNAIYESSAAETFYFYVFVANSDAT